MPAPCAMFPESTPFLVRCFKNGMIKNFTDVKDTGTKNQSEKVLIKTMEDVWDSFPSQHVDFNNCCLLLITEHAAPSKKHVRGE